MIERKHTRDRMSQIVINGDTIYLAGQVGEGETVADQTHDCLATIDGLLAEAGSDREHILQAVIWLADMGDFDAMNAVWDKWIPLGHAPARACGESRLAAPRYRVEITVIAARA
ncbi:RidA family protein [Jannaschia sp. S6380]|uniref:RidA family protein n=1 Tax=Jannaschia sp. S6380 TaxID=2926408 RepID=UPI001FF264B3|nr:RidA family protein [Jannaschia sp. S6380]MCK0168013.1 RidA family protein [Jannaschia sp. S6380]